MKLAVLFRGPIRPSRDVAHTHVTRIVHELQSAGHKTTTWLATWRYYKNDPISAYVASNYFDNVIMTNPPTHERIAKFTTKTQWDHPFWMYYQTKTAIDLIVESDDYDYIIHARPDLHMVFGSHMDTWFDSDNYCSPWTGASWINDFIGIARPEIMQKSWNYGSLKDLGRLMETSEIPEHMLMTMQKNAGITNKMCQFDVCTLDPARFS